MTAALLIGRARGERSSGLPALGLAISLLILADPFQAIDPGFALSVSATAGILLLAPRLTAFFSHYLSHYLSHYRSFEKLAELLAIPIAATIFCTPLIIAISGQFSLVALPANLLASELVGPITIVGFIAALLAPIASGFTHLLLLICKPCAGWVVLIAHTLGSLPLIKLPKSFLGTAISLVVIVLLSLKRWRLLAGLLSILLIAHFLTGMGWPGRSWLFVNCDVGQGDGGVVNLGEGNAVVIDTGPDPAAMDSCLKALHISKVPLLVLTHYHADHVNGLSGVLAHRTIGQVWITNNPQPPFEYQQTMDLLRGRSMSIVHQGEKLRFKAPIGDIDITVLWPRSEIEKLPSLPGDGSGINNSSIALMIAIGGTSFYTSGDTEPPAQEEIAASGLVHGVDVMKVSHHGSAYQDLALFDLLHPKIALISVGAGNPYGHPAPSTIAALEERGIKVYRTDRDGAIAIGSDLKISTQKHRWWEISWE
jgi:competence protein ComEC